MIIDKHQIETLIPQRAPIVLVDELLTYSETSLQAAFTISEHLFVTNNQMQEGGIIEHMAQSVALHTGYSFYLKNETPPTGYIGAVNKVEIFRLPLVGEQLISEVSIIQEFAGVTLVDINTFVDEVLVATSQMKTVIAS